MLKLLVTMAFLNLLPVETAAFALSWPHVRKGTFCLASSKDDEIAQLEERLRQLREAETQNAVLATPSTSSNINTPNRPDEPFVEMLTESWKEADPVEGKMGGGAGNSVGFLLPLVGGILATIFLLSFAQVPVGQEDFAKYAAVKTSTEIDLGDLNDARIKAIQGL